MVRKVITLVSLMAATASSAGFAATAIRPQPVSYAVQPAKISPAMRGAARTGAKSKVDDGTTLILVAAAGVAGYFLHDIIDDDDDSVSGQ